MFKFLNHFKIITLFFVLFSCVSSNGKHRNKSASSSGTITNPNILWIVADDLGTDLGCYGNPLVYTPNLDKLASQGTKYDHVYTVAAVCSVSRSALITGMYPVSIGCQQHRTQFKDSLPEPVRPITQYFKEAGYFVCNNGKTDYNFLHQKEHLFNGTDWSQRKKDQPFFAQIQISLPHRPFQRDLSHPIDVDKIKLPPYYSDHPLVRMDWAMYLETIQLLDKKVGEILERLEKDGLAKNTVVFFFGDQGRPHVRAKQFLYDAGINTPLIIRWPGHLKSGILDHRLINNLDIAPTTMNIANIDPPRYMQGKDFLNDHISPRKYVYAMRDRRDETVDRIRMIRSRRFKYIRNFYPERPYTQFNAYKKSFYPVLTLMQVLYKKGRLTPDQARFFGDFRPKEELYDLQKDPFELYNLANSTAFKNEKLKLSSHLNRWLKKVDFGNYPEDPSEIKYAKRLMSKRFAEQMEAKGLTPDTSDEDYLEYWEKKLLH